MTQHDWTTLTDSVIDPAELKQRLDLVDLCEALGIMLEPGHDGKYHGICPFHDDHVSSFDVYVNDRGEQRVGCFACDFGNGHDHFDLVKALRHCTFGEALREVAQIATATRASGVRRAIAPTKAPVDLVPFVTGALARADEDRAAIHALFSDREILAPADWVVNEFRLGVTPDGGGVVVPHYSKELELVAAKTRRGGDDVRPWKPMAVTGSSLSELYGVWRDQQRKNVVLVEGESDTWTTSYLLRGYDYEVFGLPSGAAARPRKEWIDLLADRDVTLLFDADNGGRVALRNWSQALGVVKVAQLDEGHDPTNARADRVVDAVLHATTLGTGMAPGLSEGLFGGYFRTADQAQVPQSDFVLKLLRTIQFTDEGTLFEVALPNGRAVLLPHSELHSDARLRAWANAYDHAWYGNTKDAQELLRMLVADAAYVPKLRGTRVAGWNEDCFVFPEPAGCIGGGGWAYVPPVANINIERSLHLGAGSWEPHVPALVARLHRPDVITPILGWIAAAPLRGTMKQFPILALVGGAGWGKTTLVRETLNTFGFDVSSTLTSTTPHAVASFAASTNAAPVWFDEYRKGAREDARMTFDQIVRDAWEASASYKGGLGEQRQALTAIEARAPIVVTGEDAFQETSHMERMAVIHLPRDGRSSEALLALRAATRDGFGRAYLEWLAVKYKEGALPAVPTVTDRSGLARAIVQWGYSLLDAFCRELLGYELPAYDESLLVRAHADASEKPVLLEAIEFCINRTGRSGPIAWREGAVTVVRLHDLVREARDNGIVLPGNARATQKELEQRFHVTESTNEHWGQVLELRERTS